MGSSTRILLEFLAPCPHPAWALASFGPLCFDIMEYKRRITYFVTPSTLREAKRNPNLNDGIFYQNHHIWRVKKYIVFLIQISPVFGSVLYPQLWRIYLRVMEYYGI